MDGKVIGNGSRMFKTMENFGLDPRHLRAYDNGPVSGGVPFTIVLESAASVNSVSAFADTAPFPFRITGVQFIAQGAGDTSDTCQITTNDGSSDSALTDEVDTSSSADKAVFNPATIDLDEADVPKGGNVKLVTASDYLVRAEIRCLVKTFGN